MNASKVIKSLTMQLDPCLTNPCLNGGDCFTINNIIACNCPTGFTGIENTKY